MTKQEAVLISVGVFVAKKEPSTRRILHADVNTRKGANGELFGKVDSLKKYAQLYKMQILYN